MANERAGQTLNEAHERGAIERSLINHLQLMAIISGCKEHAWHM